MIKINIAAVGTLKEKYWKDAINEYAKRLSSYANFNITECYESKNDCGTEEEGRRLLPAVKGYAILTDLSGKQVSSGELADIISRLAVNGQSEITFIIGGSRGVSGAVKERADMKIAFGNITFPHQLMRVVLTEQIYRAFTIINGTNYHK